MTPLTKQRKPMTDRQHLISLTAKRCKDELDDLSRENVKDHTLIIMYREEQAHPHADNNQNVPGLKDHIEEISEHSMQMFFTEVQKEAKKRRQREKMLTDW